jgi:hypothetical protein
MGHLSIDESVQPSHNPDEMKRYLQLGELAYCRERQRMATEYIRADAARFAAHSAARIVSFWSSRRILDPLICQIIALVSCFGLGLFLKDAPHRGIPFISPLILYPLPYYLTHAQNVFRHPIEPAVCMLVAYGTLSIFYGRKVSQVSYEGAISTAPR